MESDRLIAFSDLTGYLKFTRGKSATDAFAFIDAYYEFVGDLIEGAGGRVVKFIGDAALLLFPSEKADAGVLALRRLNEEGDRWLAARGMPGRHIIKAHFGPVAWGPVGTRGEKRFDALGETVNTAATLVSHGLAISTAAFRRLSPATRKLFKKHTPPITYIPVEEKHRD